MSSFEALRIALSSLVANRLRAVLTTLGIVIGVGSVVSLISLGRGVEDFIAAEFEALGSNLLVVFSNEPASETRTRIEPLTSKEAADLANPSIAPSIAELATDFRMGGTIKFQQESMTTSLASVSANFTSVRTWDVRDGVFISQQDVDDAARVVVLGTTVVEELWGDKLYNPVGEQVQLNDRFFTVVGVMEELGGSMTGDDETIFIPISTGQTRMARARTRDGGYRVDVIWMSAVSEERIDDAVQEISAYLDEAHRVEFEGEQDYEVASQADVLDSLAQVTGLLTVFLGLISSISLLVGGIGIMNIMLVTVTERTREIGLRKAVGARGRDIMLQFLIESIVLSFLGGAIGVGIGFLVTTIGTAAVPGLTLSITPNAIGLAVGVSGTVGIVFGLYPAGRAAAMRPIDALRYE
jgi:putative ABC transport system permease protein